MFRAGFLRVSESSFLKTVLTSKIFLFRAPTKTSLDGISYFRFLFFGKTIFNERIIERRRLSNNFFLLLCW